MAGPDLTLNVGLGQLSGGIGSDKDGKPRHDLDNAQAMANLGISIFASPTSSPT